MPSARSIAAGATISSTGSSMIVGLWLNVAQRRGQRERFHSPPSSIIKLRIGSFLGRAQRAKPKPQDRGSLDTHLHRVAWAASTGRASGGVFESKLPITAVMTARTFGSAFAGIGEADDRGLPE